MESDANAGNTQWIATAILLGDDRQHVETIRMTGVDQLPQVVVLGKRAYVRREGIDGHSGGTGIYVEVLTVIVSEMNRETTYIYDEKP